MHTSGGVIALRGASVASERSERVRDRLTTGTLHA